VLVIAQAVLAACASVNGLPPLYESESGLPGGLSEERAAFGLATTTTGPDGARLAALRPLVATVSDGAGSSKIHVLSPVAAHTQGPVSSATAVWPLFFDTSVGEPQERRAGTSDDDTTILPLVAWGHDPEEGSYLGVFPFGGTLKGRLLADRVDFLAFPAYLRSRSQSWDSTHVLWPLVSWGEGEDRSHFRVMPLWSQTDTPTRHSRTALWPFVNWSTEKRQDRTFDGWFVFPLAGHRASTDGTYREWTALWPLFEFSSDDRTGDRSRAVLWPIHKHVVRAGESESTWWWPFYGHHESQEEVSSFYAWPVVWTSDEFRGSRESHRRFVAPLYMHRWAGPRGGAADEEEFRSWPLVSWRRRPDGLQTLRIPEIVPFFGWEPGETLYADVLTLFRWSADDRGRTAWDGPLSLVRYRRDERGSARLTLLWWFGIPLGGGR
jgi:hypothetical protein